MAGLICACQEEIEALIPYIDKPVYIRGYHCGKEFDGWTVIYNDGSWGRYAESAGGKHLVFDYRGETYFAYAFLPIALGATSNAFYEEEV